MTFRTAGLAALAIMALLVTAVGAAADQSEPANEAPNIRSETNRDTREGYGRVGAEWISDHVKSYEGNGNSSFAPASSKANGAADPPIGD